MWFRRVLGLLTGVGLTSTLLLAACSSDPPAHETKKPDPSARTSTPTSAPTSTPTSHTSASALALPPPAVDGGTDDGSPDRSTTACTVPDGATCTVAPQCGCAADETCGFSLFFGKGTPLDGNPSCIRSTGDKDAFTTCSSTSDCAPGLLCVQYVNTGGLGVCNAPSAVTTDGYPDCPLETRPGKPNAGVGFSWPIEGSEVGAIFACSPRCDFMANTGCKTGMQCTVYGFGANAAIPTCRPQGTLPMKTACSTSDDQCAPGLFCGTSDPRCYRWCRVGHDDDCGADTSGTCERFGPPFVAPDGTEVGYCGMP
jgi:hypothetical protein